MGKWLPPESLLLLVNICELSESLSKKKKKINHYLGKNAREFYDLLCKVNEINF